MQTFSLVQVRSSEDVAATAALFKAYAASLDVDLAYQDFEAELASLPGKYASPSGELLLARADTGRNLGCVALRPVEPEGCCEMKRLYVSPDGRGLGLGRTLAEGIIREAARIGYREILLDTLPTMSGAMSLYRKLGFEEIDPYNASAVPGTLFMRLKLPQTATKSAS